MSACCRWVSAHRRWARGWSSGWSRWRLRRWRSSWPRPSSRSRLSTCRMRTSSRRWPWWAVGRRRWRSGRRVRASHTLRWASSDGSPPVWPRTSAPARRHRCSCWERLRSRPHAVPRSWAGPRVASRQSPGLAQSGQCARLGSPSPCSRWPAPRRWPASSASSRSRRRSRRAETSSSWESACSVRR